MKIKNTTIIFLAIMLILFVIYPPRILRGLTKEDPQLNWLEKPIGFSQANN